MVQIIEVGTGLDDFIRALQDRSQQYKALSNSPMRIVSNAEYSGYVDQGTRYMEAQPFFQETVESADTSMLGADITSQQFKQFMEMLASEMRSKAPIDTGYLQSEIRVEG